jgi:hypothetical protein
MNFYFEEGDIVVRRAYQGVPGASSLEFVLVQGFDRLPKGFRIWWADPIVNGQQRPGNRVRMYTNEMVRVRRPKEELRLAERAERWRQKRLIATFTRKVRAEIKERARLRKHGIALNDTPWAIPNGKWVSPEGLRQIMTDVGFKPETIDKRVKMMERAFRK